jgi:hypothetical protein
MAQEYTEKQCLPLISLMTLIKAMRVGCGVRPVN